jgi:hypothetical protein
VGALKRSSYVPLPAIFEGDEGRSFEVLQGKYHFDKHDKLWMHFYIQTPPSSKIRSIRPFLVFRAHGRYSAFRLRARHVRSADTSRRENASSA